MNGQPTPLSDRITFAEEAHAPAATLAWKILVADDEEEVHKVTRLALTDFRHFGRPIELLHAYSGAESVQRMREHPDVALVLMDVVMETDHAGLDAVLAIRHELKNSLVRIVIRTGQPGEAPEDLVVRHYDINDYKEKTEVTARKLHTLVHNGLSLYRELAALNGYKQGLEQVIGAATALQAQRSEEQFARSALQQLIGLLYADPTPADALMVQRAPGRPAVVLAGCGKHGASAGQRLDQALSAELHTELDEALRDRTTLYGQCQYVTTLTTASGVQLLLYVAGEHPVHPADATHVSLFCRNVAIGFDNLRLMRALKDSQRNLILLLSTAIEQRSHAGGGHGQRVAMMVRLLGELHGLPEAVLEWLPLAATLHDVGQIAIPEAILNKREPLTGDEKTLLESHTRWGQDLLWSQDSDIMQIAGLIAGQHHERWDGAGYPAGLRGEQIHLYARVTGLADAFDELVHPPLGARPRPLTGILLHLEHESGKQFDPLLVSLLIKNIDRFMDVVRGRS